MMGLLSANSPTLASGDQLTTEGCKFTQGFAKFRDRLGLEIVGDCVSDQMFTEAGDAFQRTTIGVMEWSASENAVTFTDRERTWIEGVGSLQSNVRIGGMRDVSGPRRTSAMSVLANSLLIGADVPAPYLPYSPHSTTSGRLPQARHCAAPDRSLPDGALGRVAALFLDADRRQSVSHKLLVFPEGNGSRGFALVTQGLTDCPANGPSTFEQNGRVVQQITRRTVTPRKDAGNEAVDVLVVIDVPSRNRKYVSEHAVVRYADVVSVVTASPPPHGPAG